MATFRYNGDTVEYTPSSAVTAGDVVVQGELVGVAMNDIAADAKGALTVKGVFDFSSGTSTSNAFTAGALTYWDDTNDIATTTSGGNKLIGKCVVAASAAATTVRIRMDQ